MLSEEELKGAPLLVFCNKQDVDGALKPEEISEKLGLAGGEKTRPWSVRGSCATKGEGLEDGLDWYGLSFRLPDPAYVFMSGLLMQYSRNNNPNSRQCSCFKWSLKACTTLFKPDTLICTYNICFRLSCLSRVYNI